MTSATSSTQRREHDPAAPLIGSAAPPTASAWIFTGETAPADLPRSAGHMLTRTTIVEGRPLVQVHDLADRHVLFVRHCENETLTAIVKDGKTIASGEWMCRGARTAAENAEFVEYIVDRATRWAAGEKESLGCDWMLTSDLDI